MRRILAVFCLVAFTLTLAAQPPSTPAAKPKAAAPQAQPAPPQVVKDLPVRKVVLYKNGVGYFEHAGTVLGNQRVAIDFTSPQLNDVLQSLTVLDEGGGRIGGVNYNSTTPLAAAPAGSRRSRLAVKRNVKPGRAAAVNCALPIFARMTFS